MNPLQWRCWDLKFKVHLGIVHTTLAIDSFRLANLLFSCRMFKFNNKKSTVVNKRQEHKLVATNNFGEGCIQNI